MNRQAPDLIAPLNFFPIHQSNPMKTAPPLRWSNLKNNPTLDFLTRSGGPWHENLDQGPRCRPTRWRGHPGEPPGGGGPDNPNINRVEMDQEPRVHQGLYSGRLTPGKFRPLENQQALILTTEAQMRADGCLTRGEKTQLAQMQARANRNIYHYKHNHYRPVKCRPGKWRAGWC
jgi:hypothetical protein